MALVQLESIETGFHNSYGHAATKGKKRRSAPCFAKMEKEHLKKRGDTFMFQKGQVFVVGWIEKKRQKTCYDCFNNHQSNMALHLMFLPRDSRIREGLTSLTVTMFYEWSTIGHNDKTLTALPFLYYLRFGCCQFIYFDERIC